MKKYTLLVLSFALPISTAAMAYGGSNLGPLGYPSNECSKPSKPIKPYSFESQMDVDAYNQQVDTYNWELRNYLNCVRDYLEGAQDDIADIKSKMQEAVDEANS